MQKPSETLRNFESMFRYFGKSSKNGYLAASREKYTFPTFAIVVTQISNINH